MQKTVVITGASSGFGNRGAKRLAERGHAVYATMRDIGTVNAGAAEELSALGNITVLPLEMSNTKDNEDVVERVIQEHGHIDVVINNAGSFFMGIGEAFTEEDILQIYNVDVLGPWRLIRAALPHMREAKSGYLLSVSSSLARFSCPYMTAYSSAKHALEGLLQGLKYELKAYNIDVSFIEPGIYPTRVFERYRSGSDQKVKESYGAVGDIDRQIKAQLDGLFSGGHANDPMLVADAMVHLVEAAPGQRPIRIPVDPAAGIITDHVNSVHAEAYLSFLQASGMGGLL
jgi:NAD(P)-dependent dehydrogenase (short-subunit alcohol dehydrogenase family)